MKWFHCKQNRFIGPFAMYRYTEVLGLLMNRGSNKQKLFAHYKLKNPTSFFKKIECTCTVNHVIHSFFLYKNHDRKAQEVIFPKIMSHPFLRI